MDELRRALDAIAERTDDEEVVVLVAEARTAMQRAALAARSEPGAEGLREAVVAYFDGRRRRAPAAEMLRLITKMGDSLAATPAADSRGLDPERLMVAVFNADQPGDWPTWDDYIAAFGSAGTPPWRRKAEAIAREYAALESKS